MNDKQIKNKPDYISVLDLFNNPKDEFIIPIYQRKYSWKNTQLNRFINDLKNTLKHKDTKKHFMGILIYQIKSDIEQNNVYNIIDGQQRITTLFIFLIALNECINNTKNNQLEIDYLKKRYLAKNEYTPKLKSFVANDNNDLNLIFSNDIINQKSSSNIIYAYNFFKNIITDLIKQYGLKELLDVLQNKIYFLIAPFENDDAQTIFETINSTGLKLTQYDLIKNFILLKNIDYQNDIYDNYLKKIDNLFDGNEDKIELFFQSFLIIKKYENPGLKNIYEVFKKWYLLEISSKKVIDILKDIINYANYYYDICITNKINQLEVNSQYIVEYRALKIDAPMVVLLWLYEQYKLSIITSKQFDEILDLIISYWIRRSICGNKSSSKVSENWTILLQWLFKFNNEEIKNNVVEYVRYFLVNQQKNKSTNFPNDYELKECIKTKNFFKEIKPVVYVLFYRLAYKSQNRLDYKEYSIEHIMPQKPKNNDIKKYGMDTIEEFNKYLHLIGNLLFISFGLNSKLKNGNQEEKCDALVESAMATGLDKREKLYDLFINWDKNKINEMVEIYYSKIVQYFPYIESNIDIDNKIKELEIKETKYDDIDNESLTNNNQLDEIYYDKKNLSINAIYNHQTGDVIVKSGSIIYKWDLNKEYKKDNQNSVKKYKELLDKKIIIEYNTCSELISDYTFVSKNKGKTSLTKVLNVFANERKGKTPWINKKTDMNFDDNKLDE